MSLCPSCVQDAGARGLCPHHDGPGYGAHDWAAENRLVCNLVHRGIAPPRYRGEDAEPIPPVEESAPCA